MELVVLFLKQVEISISITFTAVWYQDLVVLVLLEVQERFVVLLLKTMVPQLHEHLVSDAQFLETCKKDLHVLFDFFG